MLELHGINKIYKASAGNVHALKDVSMAFRQNEFVSVLGPSGCGKTTLLNILGGLDGYTSGDLVINGRSTKAFKNRDWDVYRNHRVGFVFQSYNLIPHQSVLTNVALALAIAGVDKKERIERAKAALDKVGLSDQYKKKPNQLSGGQSQRVAIARALVNEPEILLADEPTGALDSETSVQIMQLIKEIAKERLVIMVTHNPELAEIYSTRIIQLKDGKLTSDSNPYFPEEEAKTEVVAAGYSAVDNYTTAQLASGDPTVVLSGDATAAIDVDDQGDSKKKKPKKERAKMSFLTALRFSLASLFSRKGRTIMVAIAGAIGIIGISLVLAVSWGMQGFIRNMQEDMLSGFPITIAEESFNINALMEEGAGPSDISMDWRNGRVNVATTVANLVRQLDNMDNMILSNEITEDYIEFIRYLRWRYPNLLAEVVFDYGLNLTHNIFASFTPAGAFNPLEPGALQDGDQIMQSIASIRAIYTSMLQRSAFDDFAPFIAALDDPFRELPQNHSFITDQYRMLGGRFAQNANELMIVLQEDSLLSDLFLAQLGFFTQNEFMNLVFRSTSHLESNMNHFFNEELNRDSFTVEEILEREFIFYPNNTVFAPHVRGSLGLDNYGFPIIDVITELPNPPPMVPPPVSFQHLATHNHLNQAARGINPDFCLSCTQDTRASCTVCLDGGTGIPLRIVGILEPRESTMFGSLQSGFYYTHALREEIFRQESEQPSQIVEFLARQQGNSITSIVDRFQAGTIVGGDCDPDCECIGGDDCDCNCPGDCGCEPFYLTMASGIVFEYHYTYPYNLPYDAVNVDGCTCAICDCTEDDCEEEKRCICLAYLTTTRQIAAAGAGNPLAGMAGRFDSMFGMPDIEQAFAGRILTRRGLSGQNADGATIASFIQIYASRFANLTRIRSLLDRWNDLENDLEFTRHAGTDYATAVILPASTRSEITYNDFLSMIVDMLNQLVFIITVALIGFMSLALVVSTIMISIITYVSVVERTKEIGVIRSLGGRKLDVAYLFNAETIIIGLLAGIIAVLFTYFASFIINLIVGIYAPIVIADFPWFFALMMVGLSVFLTFIAGLAPSRAAAKKNPVVALRSD